MHLGVVWMVRVGGRDFTGARGAFGEFDRFHIEMVAQASGE